MQLPNISQATINIETVDGCFYELEVSGEFTGYKCVESVREGLRQLGLYTSRPRKSVRNDGTHKQCELKVA